MKRAGPDLKMTVAASPSFVVWIEPCTFRRQPMGRRRLPGWFDRTGRCATRQSDREIRRTSDAAHDESATAGRPLLRPLGLGQQAQWAALPATAERALVRGA